jgi:hypothetical protein
MLDEDNRTKLFWERIIIGSFAAGRFFTVTVEDIRPREHGEGQSSFWDAVCIVKLDGRAEQIQLHIIIARTPEMYSFELPYDEKPEVQSGINDSQHWLKMFRPVKDRLTEICSAVCS